MNGHLLRVDGLSKNFGGLKALDAVELHLNPLEILGLIGPNGAGKSTLFNCLSGHLPSNAGRIEFGGEDVTRLRASQRARLGIGRTFQLGKVFSSMSVRENVLAGVGVGAYGSFWRSIFGLVTHPAHSDRVDRVLEAFNLRTYREAPVTELPMGIQRRVEAARAMAMNPKLLLLDEPAAGLTHGEAEEFAGIVRRIRDGGVTVIVIEHNMRFAMDLAERMYVLVEGRIIAEGPPEDIRENPDVVAAYLG